MSGDKYLLTFRKIVVTSSCRQATMRNVPEVAEPSIVCKFRIIQCDVQTGVRILDPNWLCRIR